MYNNSTQSFSQGRLDKRKSKTPKDGKVRRMNPYSNMFGQARTNHTIVNSKDFRSENQPHMNKFGKYTVYNEYNS